MKYLLPFLLIFFCSCLNEPQSQKSKVPLYEYDVEERIKSLGIELKAPVLPKGIKIKLAKRSGNLIYLSGNGPIKNDGTRVEGKVGTDLTIEEGYQAARSTAINHLAVLKQELGDLNKVEEIIKVLGMVNADSNFRDHPKVINGYSDLMIEVFGERGEHARSAVGMASLPWNLACELEAIVQIKED